jgi:protein-S-isoprenylcysteine O-methyltransferase Ste14
MLSKVKSYLLVLIQFACLIGIAVTGPLIARHPIWLTVEVAALGLALWAFLAMRVSKLNVTPDVRRGAVLVRAGPYRFIRHPMYSSLLIGSLALVLDDFTPLRGVVWLILLADIVVKLSYEERLLSEAFADYAEYRRETKRLVPWIY